VERGGEQLPQALSEKKPQLRKNSFNIKKNIEPATATNTTTTTTRTNTK